MASLNKLTTIMKYLWRPFRVSGKAVALSKWYAHHAIPDHGTELPRATIRGAHSIKRESALQSQYQTVFAMYRRDEIP